MKIKFLMLFILAFTLNLYADSVTSGNTISVNSDSSFNALRNPALMSRQYAGNISFMYQYSYLMNSDADVDVELEGIDAESEFSQNEDYNGILSFSKVFHSGRSSYGIGISGTGDGQVAFGDTEISLQLGSYDVTSTEEKKYIGSTLMLSYSYKLNNHESFGMQIETAGSSESIEKEKKGTEESTLNIDKNRLTSGCSFGYYLFENNYEFGAVFKSGRYGVENQKYELNKNSVDSDEEISNYYMNDEGPGLLFGFGIKPSSKFKVFFETGYTIPYSHEEKSCDDDTLAESTDNVNLAYTYGARGGISYMYSRFINIGFGGSYIRNKTDYTDKDNIKRKEEKFSVYQVTVGVDIKPSKEYTLLFGFIYKRVAIDIEEEKSTSRFGLGLTDDYLEAMAGISCNY